MLKALNATLNRRRLLMGLAAASTAAATAGTVAALEAVTPENPVLLALGDKLSGVHGEFVAASKALREVVREWLPRWPSIPDDCIALRGFWCMNDRARDLTGYGVEVNGEPVRLHSLRSLEREAADLRKSVTTRRPRNPLTPDQIAERLSEASKVEATAERLRAHLAECDRVRNASGYVAAFARETAALDALSALVGEIVGQPAATMEGVLIKAEALNAWQSVPERILRLEASDWPGVLAADVLRIAARSA